MLNKDECRTFINSRKSYLNMSAICRECDVKPPHLSYFLKGAYYNHYISVDKANDLVNFIKSIF